MSNHRSLDDMADGLSGLDACSNPTVDHLARLRVLIGRAEAVAQRWSDLFKQHLENMPQGSTLEGEAFQVHLVRYPLTTIDASSLRLELPDVAHRFERVSQVTRLEVSARG